MRNLLLILLAFMSLASCKSKKISEDEIFPPRLLYNRGKELLEAGDYKKASAEFEKIYFQHPGSEVTPYAELMEAYSLFLGTKYEDAADVLENFIKIHPLHSDISYAYYLKGLSEYMQVARAQLDQTATENARKAFEDVITRFPGTKYALDASLKIDLVYDHLAGSEMEVGRYYLHVNNPISAATRFQHVVQKYSTTQHAPEALYRLVESYLKLSLYEEAKKYGAILGHNYKDNKWYHRAYKILKNHKPRKKASVRRRRR